MEAESDCEDLFKDDNPKTFTDKIDNLKKSCPIEPVSIRLSLFFSLEFAAFLLPNNRIIGRKG